MAKFFISITIAEALMLIFYFSSQSQLTTCAPKEEQQQQQSKDNRNQPLSNLNHLLKQNNNIKLDTIVNDKMVSNMTIAFNEMALNFGKMLGENKRLSNQIQEVVQRVQNVTGVNANSTIKNIQQQANNSNMSLASFNLNNLIPRFD